LLHMLNATAIPAKVS